MLNQLNNKNAIQYSHYLQHSKKVQLLESALNPKNGIINIPQAYHSQYDLFYRQFYINYMRITAILAPLLFISIAIIDWMFLTEPHTVMFIRLGIILPLLLIIAMISLTQFFINLEQPLMIATTVIISIGILSIIYYVPLENKYFHLATLLIIQIVLFTLARIKFWYGVILIILIWLGSNIVLLSHSAPIEFFIERNYLFLTSSLLAIFTGFMMEQTTRRTFLQESLLELEKKYLSIANKRLNSIASLDSLTNIPNRRYFISSLTKEWHRALRFNYPLALLMMDIDNFKMINDTYGHLFGDFCLQQFALNTKNLIQRSGDLFIRYGGDEFAVLLIATDRDGAEKISSTIKHATENLKICTEDNKLVEINVSIGVSVLFPSKENKPRELIIQADKNLYQFKRVKY